MKLSLSFSTKIFIFDPNSMIVIFLGTNYKFCQKARQILENRPLFIEWEQNVILLSQKMLLFSCFQEHFVTNLIWKRKRKQTQIKKQLLESSREHLCLLYTSGVSGNVWWQFWQGYLEREHILQFSEEAIYLDHQKLSIYFRIK